MQYKFILNFYLFIFEPDFNPLLKILPQGQCKDVGYSGNQDVPFINRNPHREQTESTGMLSSLAKLI